MRATRGGRRAAGARLLGEGALVALRRRLRELLLRAHHGHVLDGLALLVLHLAQRLEPRLQDRELRAQRLDLVGRRLHVALHRREPLRRTRAEFIDVALEATALQAQVRPERPNRRPRCLKPRAQLRGHVLDRTDVLLHLAHRGLERLEPPLHGDAPLVRLALAVRARLRVRAGHGRAQTPRAHARREGGCSATWRPRS